MKDEKILLHVRQSKQELLNYMDEIVRRTSDEQLKDDLRTLRRFVDGFAPCKNLKAIELDRKVKSLIGVYRDKRLHHDNILGRENTESAVKAEVYDEANKKMFDRLSVMLENMLTERAELDALVELDRKQLKGLSDFERTNYLNRATAKKNEEEKWNINATLLNFEMERLKLFYERKACDRMKDIIFDEWENDEANADSYREQLAALDEEIENLSQNEQILLKQIANHKQLRGMLGNLDLEKFIRDNQYANEQLEKVFKDVASKTKELQKKRVDSQSRIDVVVQSAKESRREGVPKQNAATKDKYELEIERRRQMKMERELGPAGAPKSQAENAKENGNEKAGR